MSLGVEATALASEGMAPSIRTPTLPLEVDSPRPQPVEPMVDGDIPRRVEKPSAEIMALPLEHITTTFIGESVLPTPGLPELYGEECMSMVVAMGGRLMLPSIETVDMAPSPIQNRRRTICSRFRFWRRKYRA